jgi:predicted PurR-regulated permease PerM
MQAIFERVFGMARGKEFTNLSTATVRAVASGVIGIACIQALIIGVSLMIAGVPFAGVLAVIVLVLGIAQLPALLVTLPVIGWIWASGDYGTVPAAAYSVLLFVGGMADNVLKPMMLGRGVDAPMPVILIGALGGMATGGILGMFIGATALALGYQIFMRWVDDNPERALQDRPLTIRPPPPPEAMPRRFAGALGQRLLTVAGRCCSGAAPQSGRTSNAPK